MYRFSWQNLPGFALLVCFVWLGSFTSCISPKETIYFNDLPDTISASKPITITTVKYTDPIIIPNDILSITVQTIAQNENSNQPITSSSVALFNPLNGFLVDKNGNVELSLIGFVKVGGLTTAEARELIKEKAKEFYKDPVVNCRIANFDVIFLGDVNAPGTYQFPSEKVDLFEGLAAAHDVSITGKRKDVLLIRSEGETKKFIRFNLNSSETFKSPYLYMRQRDLVYVEPYSFKIRQTDQTFSRNLGILTSIISLAALILAFRNYK